MVTSAASPLDAVREELAGLSPVYPDPNNLGDVLIYAKGRSSVDARVRIEAVDAGNLGTMTYKASIDGGGSFLGRHPITDFYAPANGADFGYMARVADYLGTLHLAVDANGDGKPDRIISCRRVDGYANSTPGVNLVYRNAADNLWSTLLDSIPGSGYTWNNAFDRNQLGQSIVPNHIDLKLFNTAISGYSVGAFVRIYVVNSSNVLTALDSNDGGRSFETQKKATSGFSATAFTPQDLKRLRDGSVIYVTASGGAGSSTVTCQVAANGLDFAGSATIAGTAANTTYSSPIVCQDSSGKIIVFVKKLVVAAESNVAYESTDGGATWGAYTETLWSTTKTSLGDAACDANGTIYVLMRDAVSGGTYQWYVATFRPGDAAYAEPAALWDDNSSLPFAFLDPDGSVTLTSGDRGSTGYKACATQYWEAYSVGNEVFTPTNLVFSSASEPRTTPFLGGISLAWHEGADGATTGDFWTFNMRVLNRTLDYYQGQIRNPQGKLHWLLLIEAPGEPLLLADADLQIPDRRLLDQPRYWEGRIQVNGTPSISVDPYETGRASVANVGITVVPRRTDPLSTAAEIRFQDRPIAAGWTWAEVPTHLFRWAEGTPFAQAQPVISGRIERFMVNPDGSCEFDLIDNSLVYDIALPVAVVDSVDTWPNASEDAAGQGYPIVYGSFVRINIPEVDTTNEYCVLAGHLISAMSAAYLDGVLDGSAVASAQFDAKGRYYSRVAFSTNIGSARPTASGTGPTDNADGEYAGVAGGTIVHPAAIIAHMARNIVLMDEKDVETGQFRNMVYPYSGWEYTISLGADDSSSFFDEIGRMARWMRSVVFFYGPLLTIRRLNFKASPLLALDATNIVAVHSVEDPGALNVYNDITLKYSYLYNTRQNSSRFTKAITLDDTNDERLRLSRAAFGRRALRLESRNLNDTETAKSVVALIVELAHKPRLRVSVTTTAESNLLTLFDLVTVSYSLGPSSDGAGWVDKPFAVIGIQHGLGENTLDLLEV